jgi:hypothetical protein
MSIDDFPKLMLGAEVAALFSVDPKTVTRWGWARKLTVIKTPGGGISLYLETEVHDLLTKYQEGDITLGELEEEQ